jgi:chemotaxis signal transduction protein
LQIKGSNNDNSVIQGYSKRDERVVILLNIERLASDPSIDLGRITEENQHNN